MIKSTPTEIRAQALQLDVVERLRLARFLVRESMRDLNRTSHECGECGGRRYDDFPEANAHKTLDGAASRIQRVVGVLLGGVVDP